jgi:hypothetical protein
MRLNETESNFLRIFNVASMGRVFMKELITIIPSLTKIKIFMKDVNDDRNRYRRDVLNKGQRVPLFLADRDYDVMIENDDTVLRRVLEPANSEWPMTAGAYSKDDYKGHQQYTAEDDILDLLEHLTAPAPVEVHPSMGAEVQIEIKGHFYNHQRGIVLKYRDGQYLVNVTTKKPSKTGYPAAEGAQALVWIYPTDVKLVESDFTTRVMEEDAA